MTDQQKTKVNPEIKFLGDLLDEISKGDLLVPNFQRPFVWRPKDMIALFESIISGYPIGSLLFWKTENKYNSLDFIGPYKVLKSKEVQKDTKFILDGHQRLSTLYGVLANPSKNQIIDDNNFWIWEIYFDLETSTFIHIQKETPKAYQIKLSFLLKTFDFLSACRVIQDKCGDKAKEYIEKAEKLTQIIREYKITIIQIEGGDLDSAVNIFSRLNSKGVLISEDRMYSALTYVEGENTFNLSIEIDKVLEEFKEYSFSGIKRMSIFRSILIGAGKNLYTQGSLTILKDINDIKNITENCKIALNKAVNFLKTDIRVPDDKFLPYNLQLILLGEFFRLCPNPSEQKKKILEQWFWVTSFVGLDTPNTSKTSQILQEIKKFANNDDDNFKFEAVDFNEEAQPFPDRFNLTSSRVRAYVLFILSLNPKPLSRTEFNPDEALQQGYKALSYIIPQLKGKQVSKLSNRILLGPVKYGTIKKILCSQQQEIDFELTQEILDSHAITKKALQCLINNNEDEFLQLREEKLIELEKQFMINKGVKPNSLNTPQAPINDAD